jgi:hypothetical protein
MRALAPLALAFLCPRAVAACDRAVMAPNVAVAAADAIVVARVERQPEGFDRQPLEVDVERSLKGSLSTGRRALIVPPTWWLCGGARLARGTRYLFFLNQVDRQFELSLDGSAPYERANVADVESRIASTPRWSTPRDGLSVLAVPSAYGVKLGEEVALYVLYRNASKAPVTLRYRDWPLATHSYWSLDVMPDEGSPIAREPHPHVSTQDIEDYFSHNGHTFEVALAPNEVFPMFVDRINSAEPGWGYKERLDFGYYPLRKAGRYRITVTGHHFGRDEAAAPFELNVR